MQFTYIPNVSKEQITAQVASVVDNLVMTSISSIQQNLIDYGTIKPGIEVEDLLDFNIPLAAQQTADQLHDGILVSYKDGELKPTANLNGGSF